MHIIIKKIAGLFGAEKLYNSASTGCLIFLLIACSMLYFLLYNILTGIGLANVNLIETAEEFISGRYGDPTTAQSSVSIGKDKLLEKLQAPNSSPNKLENSADRYFIDSMCSRLPENKRPDEC